MANDKAKFKAHLISQGLPEKAWLTPLVEAAWPYIEEQLRQKDAEIVEIHAALSEKLSHHAEHHDEYEELQAELAKVTEERDKWRAKAQF